MSTWNLLYGMAQCAACLGLAAYLIPVIARAARTGVWTGGGFTLPRSERPTAYWTAIFGLTVVAWMAGLIAVLGLIAILQQTGFLPYDPI